MSDEYNLNFTSQEFVAHKGNVNCLSFGTQSNQVYATGGEDKEINVWKVGGVGSLRTIKQNKAPIESLCFDSIDQHLLSGAFNGSIKVYDLNKDGATVRSFSSNASITSLHYHPHGEFFASGSIDNTMKVWDVRNKTCIQTYNGHSKEITCVRFSPDGQWVASSSKDGQMLFWDLVAGKLLNNLKFQPNYVTSFEFNPTELSMAAITSARTVRLWDLATMQPTFTTPAESSPVRAIAFSNMGNALVTSAKDILKVWSIDAGEEGASSGPPMRFVDSFDMQWGDRIADMRMSDNSQLVAGSFSSNFVGVHSIDLAEVLAAADRQAADAPPAPVLSSNTRSEKRESKSSAGGGGNVVGGSEKVRTGSNVAAASAPINNSNPVSEKVASASANKSRANMLSRMGQQMSQLSDNLKELKVEEKDTPPSSYKHSNNNKHDIAEAKDIASSDSNRVKGSKASHKRTASDGGEYDDDFEDPDFASDAKSVQSSAVAPQVEWSEGQNPVDMAASINGSMWKRFEESTSSGNNQHNNNSADNEGLSDDELFDDPLGDSVDNEEREEPGPISKDSLMNMLPPSSYDNRPSSSSSANTSASSKVGGPSGVRSIQSQGVAPPPVIRTAVNKAPTPSFARAKLASPQGAGTPLRGGLRDNSSRIGSNNVEISVGGAALLHNMLNDDMDPPNNMAVVGQRHGAGALQHSVAPSRLNSGGGGSNGHVSASRLNSGGNGNGSVAPVGGGGGVVGNAEYRRADEQLNLMLSKSDNMASTLKSRLLALKGIRSSWARNDIFECIDMLHACADCLSPVTSVTDANLSTLADFFSAADISHLTVDAAAKLLEVLLLMFDYPGSRVSEHAMLAVFGAATQLAECFGELIRNTRSNISAGGVNLAAEARLAKCNECQHVFSRIRSGANRVKFQHKDKGQAVGAAIDKFMSLANSYFN